MTPWRPGVGRNGGHVNNGLAVDYADLAAKVGVERARAWYHAYDAAVDTVERIVREEGIACDFQRNGKLKLATKPHQMDALRRSADRLIADGVDTDVEILDASRVRAEVQSERFHGGLLYKRSGQMHMGRFAQGLALAAQRQGAQIHTRTCVQRIERVQGQVHRLHTARGTVQAKQVLLATGATARRLWHLRLAAPAHRAHRQLYRDYGAARCGTCSRAAGRTPHVRDGGQYSPLLPPHSGPRLVFGGRARFAVSSPQQDAASGEILRAGLAETFPQLGQVRLDLAGAAWST